MWKKLIELFKKDNLFEQAYQEASKMLDTDAAMYDASVDALRHSDTADVDFDKIGRRRVGKGCRSRWSPYH